MDAILLTCRDVAAQLHVSVRQVWKLSASGRLPKPVRIGRSVRWRAADLQRFIDNGCRIADAATESAVRR